MKHEKATHHYNIGVQLEKEGNLKDALKQFELALEEDPNFPYPYKALGEIHYRNGELESALRELTIALKLDPNWVEVMALLAEVYYDRGELERAIHFQERALKKDPNNVRYNALLGKMFVTAHRYNEAIDVFNHALKMDADNYLILYNLGVAYGKRAMEDMDLSIEHWVRARDLNDKDPQLFRNLGIGYFTKGMLREAAECFRRALELQPDDGVAKRFLKYTEGISKTE